MDSDGCINHCNETKRKSPQKIGDIFSPVTIGTNVTKGVLMIRPHLSVQHYVTRVTMVSGRCVNHCNETKRKSPKKIGDIFSHVTIGTNVTKGASMIRPASVCPALCNKSNHGF